MTPLVCLRREREREEGGGGSCGALMICSGGCQPSRWRLKTHFLTVPFGLGLEATAQMGFMLSRTRLDSGTTSASGQPERGGRGHLEASAADRSNCWACQCASGYPLMRSNKGYPNFIRL